MAKVLIIDDKSTIRSALRQLFEYEGHTVHLSSDGPSGLLDYPEFVPDITLLDIKMPGMDGLEVLARIREQDPKALVVMISGHGTIETAVRATRKGAFDFLEKPLDTDRLLVTLRNALQVKGLAASVEQLQNEVEIHHEMVGGSSAIREVIELIDKVGPTSARVLVVGENGTGKELTARALHRTSPRKDRPFVEVNCAAIPSELIESELFGHVKGSFTGAVGNRVGKFEQAHLGTLFLDEVGDMSLAAQAKVLRALQEGHITKVGGTGTISVDVRVIAATNKELSEEISQGSFREDLFYRLNVVPIQIPPLRDRREDIPMLVTHFTELISRSDGVPPKEVSDEAMDVLREMDWPGNVRELKNSIERLMILGLGDSITASDVHRLVSGASADSELPGGLMQIDNFTNFRAAAEKAFILKNLRANEWNIAETARQMQMPRSNLYKKIERYGIERD